MGIYTRDWKPSELEPGFYWVRDRNGNESICEAENNETAWIPGSRAYLCDGDVGIWTELGPRIDPPREDITPTQEIRIPVAQRGSEFAWWGNSSQSEVENRDMALDTLSHDFGPGPFDRVFTARIPIPAPQPDIEVEGEVRDA